MTSASASPPTPWHAATLPRRSVLVAPETSEVTADRTTRSPGWNEVTVRVLRSGVCTSDRPVWSAGPGTGGGGLTLGHEPYGIVLAVGPGAERFRPGDYVTGRVEHAFADTVTTRADALVPVPAGVDGDAAVAEPLGCIVEAVRRTPLDVGDRVAILGLGFMGLCLLDVLRLDGVSEIVAVDTRTEATDRAKTRGAVATFTPAELVDADDLRDSFDIVFDVTGTQAALDLSTTLVREHGALVIVGYHQGNRTVDMQAWNWKSLDVVNGHVRDLRRLNDSIARGLALVAAGRLAYGELFTHRYPLHDVDRAYRDLVSKPAGFVKGVVVLADGVEYADAHRIASAASRTPRSG